MRRSGTGLGGGAGSRPVAHTRAPKAEPKAHRINESATAQIGISRFTGRDALREGRGYEPVGPTDNVKAVGVGGGRKVYASGSQSTHGSVDRGVPSGMESTRGLWPDDPGK
jgi:hypothetical protein